ncbi:D-alanyl-D-alanine carboxypeptidase (penicillin-binding protein 5/6) [Thermocatellispora tengchongensis]|uniref:D-alanyl-D-alanine carboxypeptidase (Penicillin-binding protein 5/6) n=1 Tax=Thermocatellispora tengchongensis TaxID=1073253 RepID=A0A840P558_9ACTN|nr:D-alanyl-D-alanine carboxypeptidase family protein [Thermocatellispora tengchongensis]MBB5134482.1 D-alanyl-D-alanine carboxypeptidase (penicillin-binding protein 5/6) [Thermocatellispora tengchongensis]
MPLQSPDSPRKNRLRSALAGLAVASAVVTGGATAAQAAVAVPTAPGVPAAPAGTEVPAVPAVPAAPAASVADDNAPAVLGRAAYLLDVSTGKVRFAKQADVRMPVASLTKLMTAYTALAQAKPGDMVTVTAEDVRYASRGGAAVANLRAGDRFTVEEMLYALLLPSGADAAHALARTYGPGVEGFVGEMNATARRLGMRDTLYVNADGMPYGGGGYSTARDQTLLTEAVLRNPTLRKVTSTRYRSLPATDEHRAYTWRNTNRLLGTAGAIGAKTGFTRAAGYTLAFAAEVNGHRLVGVLLGETSSSRRFDTAAALLDWAATHPAR